jgi:hypothetical protein
MRILKSILAIVLVLGMASTGFADTCVRMLGGPGPLNNGDIKFGTAYQDYPSCGDRRVYFVHAGMIPFSSDNTIFLDALYPLASADTGTPYVSSGTWSFDNNATFMGRHWTGTGDYLKYDGTRGGAGDTGTSTAILKGDGAGGFDDATPGTDYVIPAGNVATATALAANPSDCTGGMFAKGIDANGTAVCDTPSGTGDMQRSVYDVNTDNVVDTAAALSAQYIDWNQSTGPTSIANKPSLGTASAVNVGTLTSGYLCTYTASAITCNTSSTSYQAADADLTTLSSPGNDKIFYSTGAGAISTVTLGTTGTYLKSNGTGSAPSFSTISASAGGSNNQVQVNVSGSIGGYSWFTVDPATQSVAVDNNFNAGGTISTTQSASTADYLRLRELSGNGTNYIGWTVPDAITTTYTLKFPDATPSSEMLVCAAPSGGVSQCSWSSGGVASSITYSTNPTVDASGEIAIDGTAGQVKYYGASSAYVLDPRRTENATFKTPTSGDKAKFRKPFGMTVTSVGCVTDAATSVVLDVQECDGDGANCGTILSSTITCGTTRGTGTVSDSSIAAGNYLAFVLGTVTDTPGFLYVDFNYAITGE